MKFLTSVNWLELHYVKNVIDPLGFRLQAQKQLDTNARHAILMTHMSLQLNLEVILRGSAGI